MEYARLSVSVDHISVPIIMIRKQSQIDLYCIITNLLYIRNVLKFVCFPLELN